MGFGVRQSQAPPLTSKLNLHNFLDLPEPNFCICKLTIKPLPPLYHFFLNETDIIPLKLIEPSLTRGNFSINAYHSYCPYYSCSCYFLSKEVWIQLFHQSGQATLGCSNKQPPNLSGFKDKGFFFFFFFFKCLIYFLLKYSWFALLCNLCCTAKWLSYTHTFFFHILFHYGLSPDTEYSSLCSTVGPCCLSTLYIIVYIC